jgi:peptide chain release factor 3
MEELESVLGIRSSPVVWPIGDGDRFRGVYDRLSGRLHLFDRTEHGASRAPVDARDLDDPAVESLLGVRETERLREERELLEIAGDPLDIERVARGELTPLFFGSAVTNFGIELLLDHFLALSPPPGPRLSTEGEIAPSHDRFSGFVFKIQANMDPKHRDRIAFLRVVSGVFQRDMSATNVRTQKSVRLSSPQKLFGAEREIVELAYPGDIIGLTNPGLFQLGDTIAAMPSRFAFKGFPRFACEHFGVLRNKKTEKYKQFQKGVQQLAEEGVVQLFFDPMAGRTEPTLGVVGQLQFEVIQFRLLHEYGVETVLDRLPFTSVRWIEGSEAAISQAYWSSGTRRVEDDRGRLACLFESDWSCNYFADKHPDLTLKETATGDR